MLLETSVETFPGSLHIKLNEETLKTEINSNIPRYKRVIVWRNVVMFFIFHLLAVYGVWLMITQIKWRTFLFFNVCAMISMLGVTMGAHRLWSHKSYKAKLPLRILLMLAQSSAYQNDIYDWSRDHRVHHKFTDTDADPYNTTRGFFFAHIGWVFVKKHRDVMVKGKTIDHSDLEADPVIMFQKRYYFPLMVLTCFIIPVYIPCYFWGEDWWLSFMVIGITKFIYILNITFSVNSFAHTSYGMKPYDKNIRPAENKILSLLTYGDGWHNYHHAFPWDYKTGELGYHKFNIATGLINLMAKLGLASDLKTASPEMIKRRVQRTGDGSWREDNSSSITKGTVSHDHHHAEEDMFWGWGDNDMKQDDIEHIKVFNKLSEQ